MIDELGTGRVTIRPDFTGLREAFAEMGAAVRALAEGLDAILAAALQPAPAPRAANSLSTAYHRRHVRNRRRRSR